MLAAFLNSGSKAYFASCSRYISIQPTMRTQSTHRFIALVDLDAFYASVEMLNDPDLHNKPVLIGGSPFSRGVVAAASYEARSYGCHSGMPMSRALLLCPEAQVISPRFAVYRQYSQEAMAILHRESGQVQQVSIDEAYVDLTPVCATSQQAQGIAHRMQGRILVELGLPSSVGLASSKTVAKIACESVKPQGFAVVDAPHEREFLAPLPIEALPGIGPRTARKLRSQQFTTLGEIASAPTERIVALLGLRGALLQLHAQGQDSSPVRSDIRTKSISAEETFPEDVMEFGHLRYQLGLLSARLASSLSKKELTTHTLTLKLRDASFNTMTRSSQLHHRTSDASIIENEAIILLERNWEPTLPIRLIGIGLGNLRSIQEHGQIPMCI